MSKLVEITVKYHAHTDKGLLVENEHAGNWLSRQRIEYDGDFKGICLHDEITIRAPRWYLEYKGLMPCEKKSS